MEPFVYPDAAHERRHGPIGYSQHESYRPWLRDDFTFRCVYCLARERWHKGHYGFQVDHLIPKAEAPTRALKYGNLVYACEACNKMKSDADGIPDPCAVAYRDCLKVHENGSIVALNAEGQMLVAVLRLDNAENTEFRRLTFEVISLARTRDPAIYAQLMGLPEDLPDLTRKRPPGGNSRPEGIEESWRARRARKELPEIC
ncbi:MAG: HNH endonuclease [Planctomycetes bacterium]|nr:HNH endonuclease [Planctomycetota bacterium]MBL7040186.1 HNH endonuclease [Pirellulaceae bacterium]